MQFLLRFNSCSCTGSDLCWVELLLLFCTISYLPLTLLVPSWKDSSPTIMTTTCSIKPEPKPRRQTLLEFDSKTLFRWMELELLARGTYLFSTCYYRYSRLNHVSPMILKDYFLLESFLEINSRRKSLMPVISESKLSICRIFELILCFDFHLHRFVRVHIFWFCVF